MLFVSCGEASGDMLASRFVRSLRAEGYGGHVFGMPGPRAAAEGVEARFDWHSLHLMGIFDVLPSIPRLLRLRDDMTRAIIAEKADAVVLVDSPDFHLPLMRALRRKGYGGKIYMIAPPTVWAWRPGRAAVLRECCDAVFPLFDFEVDWWRRAGVRAYFEGHPLLEEMTGQTRSALSRPRVIGLFPGSRTGEVRRLLPVLREVASHLPTLGLEGVFSVAPDLPEALKREMAATFGEQACWDGPGRELLGRCDAAVGACGTLAVESLLLDRFMVVTYRGSFSSWLAYKLFVQSPYVAIPNLLCGAVFPELLQGAVTVPRILAELSRYVGNLPYREEVHRRMTGGRARLGTPGAGGLWARTVLEASGA